MKRSRNSQTIPTCRGRRGNAASGGSPAWKTWCAGSRPTRRAHLSWPKPIAGIVRALQRSSENPMSLANIRDAAHRNRIPVARGPGRMAVARGGQALGASGTACSTRARPWRSVPWRSRLRLLGRSVVPRPGPTEASSRPASSRRCGAAFDGAVLYAAGSEALWPATPRAGWNSRSGPFARASISSNRFIGGPGGQHARGKPAGPDRRHPPRIPARPGAFSDSCTSSARNAVPRNSLSRWLATGPKRRKPRRAALASGNGRKRLARGPGSFTANSTTKPTKLCMSPQRVAVRSGQLRCPLSTGACLLSRQLFAEAESISLVSEQRAPKDKSLEKMLREALKGRLDGQAARPARERSPTLR